jgi:hypothetical protein
MEIFAVGARLVAGRKQNPPGGPRISAPPSPRPDRTEASWVDRAVRRHLSEAGLNFTRDDARETSVMTAPLFALHTLQSGSVEDFDGP